MTVSFSRPDPAEIPPALRDPEKTADKRVRRYNEALGARGPRQKVTERVLPGLDVAALQRKYGGGDAQNRTTYRIGSFKVPINVTVGVYERMRNYAAARFVEALEGQGYVVARLTERAGPYPYRDVLMGRDDPQYREMHLVAACGLKKEPEAVVISLEKEELEPIVQRR